MSANTDNKNDGEFWAVRRPDDIINKSKKGDDLKISDVYNTAEGGYPCYYIDKHNKKYNRKIFKKDNKKFVKYNYKLIELKVYKDIIKKEKQDVKDKLKKDKLKKASKK